MVGRLELQTNLAALLDLLIGATRWRFFDILTDRRQCGQD
jgi:uncharacterized membrane protein